jgi:hypothetical protein
MATTELLRFAAGMDVSLDSPGALDQEARCSVYLLIQIFTYNLTSGPHWCPAARKCYNRPTMHRGGHNSTHRQGFR